MKPICKTCGNTNTLSASTTSRWKSTGRFTGYWVITSEPEDEIDNCDLCGENPEVKYVEKPTNSTLKFKVPTYDQRVSKIKTIGDIAKQIDLAVRYKMMLRRERKKAQLLKEKIDLDRLAQDADSVVREIRANVFELENQFN